MTDEHPTTTPKGGGLATYVAKISGLLAEQGNEVHVFVPGCTSCSFLDNKVIVHQVGPRRSLFSLSLHVIRRIPGLTKNGYLTVAAELAVSWNIAHAVRRLEGTEGSFDWVQSADYRFRGLFLSSRTRPHIVRCSWARELWGQYLTRANPSAERKLAFLECLTIRRSTCAYAPSRLVCNYMNSRYGLDVHLLRPPAVPPAKLPHSMVRHRLPPKYLIHFGQLNAVKGTDYVLDAMELLAASGTSVTLCVAGNDDAQQFTHRMNCLGVLYLGELTRVDLYRVVSCAIAAVLPSRVDNLPNTAIESLVLGVPIITMRDSSIDELVSDGVNGWVVEQGSISALSLAMLEAWRVGGSWHREPQALCSSEVFADMVPEVAVANLLKLVEYSRK